jgi:hypothetical protein
MIFTATSTCKPSCEGPRDRSGLTHEGHTHDIGQKAHTAGSREPRPGARPPAPSPALGRPALGHGLWGPPEPPGLGAPPTVAAAVARAGELQRPGGGSPFDEVHQRLEEAQGHAYALGLKHGDLKARLCIIEFLGLYICLTKPTTLTLGIFSTKIEGVISISV